MTFPIKPGGHVPLLRDKPFGTRCAYCDDPLGSTRLAQHVTPATRVLIREGDDDFVTARVADVGARGAGWYALDDGTTGTHADFEGDEPKVGLVDYSQVWTTRTGAIVQWKDFGDRHLNALLDWLSTHAASPSSSGPAAWQWEEACRLGKKAAKAEKEIRSKLGKLQARACDRHRQAFKRLAHVRVDDLPFGERAAIGVSDVEGVWYEAWRERLPFFEEAFIFLRALSGKVAEVLRRDFRKAYVLHDPTAFAPDPRCGSMLKPWGRLSDESLRMLCEETFQANGPTMSQIWAVARRERAGRG